MDETPFPLKPLPDRDDLYFPDLDLYKVGVTGNIKKRAIRFAEEYEVIFTRIFDSRKEAFAQERSWKYNLIDYMVNLEIFEGNGDTEVFDLEKILLDNTG